MTDDSIDQSSARREPIRSKEGKAFSSAERNDPEPDNDLSVDHTRTTFAVWAGPRPSVSADSPWRFPGNPPDESAEDIKFSDELGQPATSIRGRGGLGRALFADEQEKRWGWQLPLFEGFFGPLPPIEDLDVPKHLDDSLPHGDMPGQLFLDLGL